MDTLDYDSTGSERHILIAVDDTENGLRAVQYVADMVGGLAGIRVTVLHLVLEPPEDYFRNEEEADEWRQDRQTEGRRTVEKHRRMLIQTGFGEDMVRGVVVLKCCTLLAECILEEVMNLKANTVVVARRGISTKEEFLLGSTSAKLIHLSRNCAVWVVE